MALCVFRADKGQLLKSVQTDSRIAGSTMALQKSSSVNIVSHTDYLVHFDTTGFDTTYRAITSLSLTLQINAFAKRDPDSYLRIHADNRSQIIDYDTITYPTLGNARVSAPIQLATVTSSGQLVYIGVGNDGNTAVNAQILKNGNLVLYLSESNNFSNAAGVSTCEILPADGTGNITLNVSYDEVPISTPFVATTSPINQYVAATAGVQFAWTYSNADGSPQDSYVLQYSTDAGLSWVPFASGDGEDVTCTVAGAVLPAGKLIWRVCATSERNSVGYSVPATAIVASTPTISNVSATATPQATVSWQAFDQEAYQVCIDAIYDSGVLFGKTYTHTAPVVLPDGAHTAKVRVQNRLGLWSNWKSATVITANAPGDAIILSTNLSGPAVGLNWAGDYTNYIVYRDGEEIAWTSFETYTDIFASAGEHDYFVRGLDADGNYTDSNSQTVTIAVPDPVITDVAAYTGSWISMALGPDAERAVDVSYTQDVAFRHYSGAVFPVAETSGYKNCSISFNVAFKDYASQTAFKKLLGCEVCYKSGKLVLHGVMASMSMHHTRGFGSCNCTITAISEVIT